VGGGVWGVLGGVWVLGFGVLGVWELGFGAEEFHASGGVMLITDSHRVKCACHRELATHTGVPRS